jgi:phosphohistidine phosphatase SixA
MWIYLFRHGIAWDREDPMCPPDKQRPLTAKGIAKTEAAALGIRQLNPVVEQVWVSDYLRAEQTLKHTAPLLELDSIEAQVFEDMQPWGSVSAFLKRLKQTNAAGIFCVGHAPHMDDVVQEAMHARNGSVRIKKAGLAILKYQDHQFTLQGLYTPAVLRRLGQLS